MLPRADGSRTNRPGLPDFLKRIAEIYEMHVYTMGTRAYAIEVCKVIDPDGGLFGGRILSRDESGSESRWLSRDVHAVFAHPDL